MDDQRLMKLQRKFSFVQIGQDKTHFSGTRLQSWRFLKHKAMCVCFLFVLEKESKKTTGFFSGKLFCYNSLEENEMTKELCIR